jgi:hypothetical protein
MKIFHKKVLLSACLFGLINATTGNVFADGYGGDNLIKLEDSELRMSNDIASVLTAPNLLVNAALNTEDVRAKIEIKGSGIEIEGSSRSTELDAGHGFFNQDLGEYSTYANTFTASAMGAVNSIAMVDENFFANGGAMLNVAYNTADIKASVEIKSYCSELSIENLNIKTSAVGAMNNVQLASDFVRSSGGRN